MSSPDQTRAIAQEVTTSILETNPILRFLILYVASVLRLWFLTFPALILLAYRRITAVPLTWIDLVALLVFLLPILHLWRITAPSRAYRALQRAALAGDWRLVLIIAPHLERKLLATGVRSAPYQCAVWSARAFASSSRLPGALQLLEHARQASPVPDHVHHASLALLHEAASDFEPALAHLQAAQTPAAGHTPWISAALLLAVHLRRPAQAREHLERALTFKIPERSLPVVSLADAIITLEEDPASTLETLTQLRPVFIARARRAPLENINLALLDAHLALAAARTSDHTLASRHLALATPVLELHAPQALAHLASQIHAAAQAPAQTAP